MASRSLLRLAALADGHRVSLVLVTALAVGLLLGSRLNSPAEAHRALHRVYGALPHYELCLRQPARPTR